MNRAATFLAVATTCLPASLAAAQDAGPPPASPAATAPAAEPLPTTRQTTTGPFFVTIPGRHGGGAKAAPSPSQPLPSWGTGWWTRNRLLFLAVLLAVLWAALRVSIYLTNKRRRQRRQSLRDRRDRP